VEFVGVELGFAREGLRLSDPYGWAAGVGSHSNGE
jgi:hypothetical protein